MWEEKYHDKFKTPRIFPWSYTLLVWDHKKIRRRNKELINDQTRFGSFFSFFKFHFTTSLKNRSWTSHRKKMYLISFLLALTSIYMEQRERDDGQREIATRGHNSKASTMGAKLFSNRTRSWDWTAPTEKMWWLCNLEFFSLLNRIRLCSSPSHKSHELSPLICSGMRVESWGENSNAF